MWRARSARTMPQAKGSSQAPLRMLTCRPCFGDPDAHDLEGSFVALRYRWNAQIFLGAHLHLWLPPKEKYLRLLL